jgi:hypothetical protein
VSSLSRRQTRRRTFGPHAYLRSPDLHNAAVRQRKAHRAYQRALVAAERAFRAAGRASDIGVIWLTELQAMLLGATLNIARAEELIADAAAYGADRDTTIQAITDHRQAYPASTWQSTRNAVLTEALNTALLGGNRA